MTPVASTIRPPGPPQTIAPPDMTQQFITFTLGEEVYGVDIMMIREIKGWTPTTSIPNAPAFIRGVINLRGIIVPILDLRARFGFELVQPTAMFVVIIINIGQRTIGLLVDAVSDIISVTSEAIRPIPEIGSGGRESLLAGLVARDGHMISLVSLESLIGTGALGPEARPDATLQSAA